MKTFEEICDEVAKEYGYHDWLTLKDDFCMSYEGYKPYLLKAAERYANYKAETAHDEGANAQMKKDNSVWNYWQSGGKDEDLPFTELVNNPYKQ